MYLLVALVRVRDGSGNPFSLGPFQGLETLKGLKRLKDWNGLPDPFWLAAFSAAAKKGHAQKITF